MKGTKRMFAVICSFAIIFSIFGIGNMYVAGAADKEVAENAIYTAPGATGSGTFNDPMDFEAALLAVEKGQTIYMLEGTYKYANTIVIAEGNDGEENNYKTLSAYPGAKVVLDFSQQPCISSNRGVILDASYWHLYGITIYGAGDNGMLLSGDYNILEMCIFENNQDTGLQLSRYNTEYNTVAEWPSYNYILNCTSRNNHDPDGEDADGFAPKLTCGEGNVFDGCLSYNNVDDGWDCYAKSATGPIGKVTLINCIAFRNGQTEDGTFTVDSDGNGFKLGGGGIGTPHTVINCLAFENKNCGFTDNNNPSAITLINCTAFDNNLAGKKYSYNVYRCRNANCINIISYSKSSAKDTFQNMSANYVVYYNGKNWFKVDTYMAFDSKNSAKQGTQLSKGLQASDFIVTESPAIGTDFHTLWRNEDGSLNTYGYAMISPESEYATFATDGKAGGARFGSGDSEYFVPANVSAIKEAAIAGVAPDFEGAAEPAVTPTPTVKPTSTPKPTATPTAKPTSTPTPTVKPTSTPTGTPTPTVAPTNTPTPTSVPTAVPTSTQAATATPTSVPDVTVTPETSVTPIEQASGNKAKDGFTEYIPLIVTVAVVAVAAVGVTFVIVRKRG